MSEVTIAADTTPADSTARALALALGVALVCAVLVSSVSVSLRPLQQANVEAERAAQLEVVLNTLSRIGHAQTLADLETHIVELDSGRYDDSIDASSFDAERAAAQAASSIAIPAAQDLAGLKRRAKHAPVYLVRDARERIELIILPLSGRGYQSTLYAWLVLDGDTRRVRALKFYKHGETPGIGARIEDPQWEARWRDLRAFDDLGVLRIGVRKQRAVNPDDVNFQVDAISGATRTSQGVDGMLRFWLGDLGFGPYLRRIQRERS